MEIEEFGQLWLKYLNKEASEEEVTRLLEFIRTGSADEYLGQFITTLDPSAYTQVDLSENEWGSIWERVHSRIGPAEEEGRPYNDRSRPKVIKMFLQYGGWAVAAAVIIIFSVVNYFGNEKGDTEKAGSNEVAAMKDIPAPHTVNAILTLADGSNIILDSLREGELIKQAGANIMKLADGKIVYLPVEGNIHTAKYNTLTVPRGSRIVNLVLADGSTVLMNAASSISYPTAFTGKQRIVEMTGEGYFEVAKDKTMPFIVRKGNTSVEVLGTHFNVNAYDDEDAINVTLLEGRVKVSQLNNSNAVVLMPGQMAQVKDDIKLVRNVDLEEVMAWKIGKFKFGEYASIGTVMRQLSRWYDIDVEYKGDIDVHIGGTISREVNVSQVLALLEMTGAVTFRRDGKKIVVMEKK